MSTVAVFIVLEPAFVTSISALTHAARVIWVHMPAMTESLRLISAALGVAAEIRALLCRRPPRDCSRKEE